MTTSYDPIDVVNFIGKYVQNELGGKVVFSDNPMAIDEWSITLNWEKHDEKTGEDLHFNYKLTYTMIETVKDPLILARAIVEQYHETKFKNRPRSGPEKGEENTHWMYVWELIELLQHLKSNDWVEPNSNYNLTFGGGVGDAVGVINFASNQIIFLDGQENIGLKGEDDAK